MLNSTEHEIYHAHICKNDDNSWHFNIDIINATSERLKVKQFFIFQHFISYEQLKYMYLRYYLEWTNISNKMDDSSF